MKRKGDSMYRTRQIRIKKGSRLYPYCWQMCHAAARLYNRGTYLIRQYATAEGRLEKGVELTENQREAYDMIREITVNTKFSPKKKWLTYGQLDYILKRTEDEAYRRMPAQANQQILKCITRNFSSFFESAKKYTKNPEAFTGRPMMPGYKKKDGMATAILTNQICKIKEGKDLRFPGTPDRMNIGKMEDTMRLKEVRIKPQADSFVIDIVMEVRRGAVAQRNVLADMEEEQLVKYLSQSTAL